MNTTKRKKNTLQIIIAITAISFLVYKASIIFSWFSFEPNKKLPVEIFHLASPIDNSLNQTHIQNQSDQQLSITATVYRLRDGMVYTTIIKLAPLERKPIVSKEQWQFQTGDVVELLNPRYKKWSGQIP